MADNFRQTPSDKIMAAVKPDSQKPLTERIGDNMAGKTDKLASHAEPESNKSATQKIIDTVTPGNDAHREHHVGDTGRQGPLDAARAAIVPDSMKSDSQVAKDHTRGKADDFGSHLQPQGTKSTGQDFIDTITPGKDTHSDHHVGDRGRQGPLDATRAAVVPDSMKSDSQIAKDYTAGKADNIGSGVQPEQNKGIVQKIKDFVTTGGTGHTHDTTHSHDTTHTGHSGGLTDSHSGHASDNYRQGAGDKLSDAIKPDAFKSNTEIQHDRLKGNADNAAGSAVPHENKSVGQKIADGLNPNSSA